MSCEKHLCSDSRFAAQRLGIIRKSWQLYFKNDCRFWDLLGVLSCWSWSITQQCCAQLQIHIVNYWIEFSVMPAEFQNAIMPLDDLQQWCALYLKSSANKYILWAVHCLCRMCRRVLLVVIWLLIGTPLRLLAAELFSTGGPLCPSQYYYETILMTLYSTVFDWRVLRAEPMPSCWPNLLFLFASYLILFFFLPRVGCVGLEPSDL